MQRNGGRAVLVIAAIIFLVFLSNVALGGARIGTFLGDIGEALVLFAAVVFFVVGILRAEMAGGSRAERDATPDAVDDR